MVASMYLVMMGSIAGILMVRKSISPKPIVAIIVVMLGILMFSLFMMILGFAYTDPNFHNNLMPDHLKPDQGEA